VHDELPVGRHLKGRNFRFSDIFIETKVKQGSQSKGNARFEYSRKVFEEGCQ